MVCRFLHFGLCPLTVRVVGAMRTAMGHPAKLPLFRRSRSSSAPPTTSPSRPIALPTSRHAAPSVHKKQWGRARFCCPRASFPIASPLEKLAWQFCAIDNVAAAPHNPFSLVVSPSPSHAIALLHVASGVYAKQCGRAWLSAIRVCRARPDTLPRRLRLLSP